MTLSSFIEPKVLDHILGKTDIGALAVVYLGLKTADPLNNNSGGTEPTIPTGGYARVATTGVSWDAATPGGAATASYTANAAALAFPVSTAAWSTGATPLTHFIIMDAASGGNMIACGALTTPRTVNAAGVTLSYAIGDLDVTLD